MLLPNLERRDIYRTAETNTAVPGTITALTNYLSIFNCPTSPADSTTTPTLAYAGNCGLGTNSAKGDGVMFDAAASTPMVVNLDFVSGGDGTANTILFAERCRPSASLRWSTTAVAPFVVADAAGITFQGVAPTPTSPTKVLNPTSTSARAVPGTNHPGGVVMVFCDRHVAFIKETISPLVYCQLMTSHTELASTSFRSLAPLNDRDLN
jgi:hypothetical protein